jgi:alpha-tubulin suppressor-like RCC1 family protein
LAEEIRNEYNSEKVYCEKRRAEEERQRSEAERQRKEQEKKKAENKRVQWERGRETAAGLKGVFANSEDHFVYLKHDGTVCAYGKNTHGECDVGSWKNVVFVAAGEHITVGVRADGSVLYAGDYRLAPTVRCWKNIKSVHVLKTNTHPLVVGLHEDGNVGATHEYVSFYRNGRFSDEKRTDTQEAVKSWHDIAAIACGGHHVLGLESDGTVLATGRNDELQCTLYMWEDVIAVEGGMYHSVGLKSNGTVVAQGGNHSGECGVEDWKNIVDIAAGPGITVGLRIDGTLIMAGSTKYYSSARFWEDIVAIAFGGSSVLYGIKANGTIEAAGDSANRVPMPKDIKLFDDAKRFVKERSQKQEEMKRFMAEQRSKEIADKKAALQKEQEQLNAQLPELKGIFSGMQRKKIESRLAEIETELKGLS